jgi:hypothetical protein
VGLCSAARKTAAGSLGKGCSDFLTYRKDHGHGVPSLACVVLECDSSEYWHVIRQRALVLGAGLAVLITLALRFTRLNLDPRHAVGNFSFLGHAAF